jgi:hypothetical protein
LSNRTRPTGGSLVRVGLLDGSVDWFGGLVWLGPVEVGWPAVVLAAELVGAARSPSAGSSPEVHADASAALRQAAMNPLAAVPTLSDPLRAVEKPRAQQR